jgi:RimJ/RimL family protein N-acetyltransferase
MDEPHTASVELVAISDVPEARDVLWEILQERADPRDANTNISHKETPSREEHDLFVINHPFWKWFLIRHKGEWIGQIRVSSRNEIGIGLLRKHRGKRLGTEAVKTLMETLKPQPAIKSVRRAGWIANIHPKNHRSQEMFWHLGFEKIQQTFGLIPDEH